jgi:Fe2+ transport system protein FeoA
MYLDMLKEGCEGIVSEIHYRITNHIDLINKGIYKGVRIRVVTNNPTSLLIEVNNARYGISKQLAGCICMEETENE